MNIKKTIATFLTCTFSKRAGSLWSVFKVLPIAFVIASGASAETDTAIDKLRLHSDNQFLTSRVNLDSSPFSIGVDTVQMLLDNLEYDAPVDFVPLPRSLLAMEKNDSICIVNRIKTPQRNAQYLFSLPLNFFQTQRVYQLAELPPIESTLLTPQGEIKNLKQVLDAYADSAMVIAQHYSYGNLVDQQIAELADNQRVVLSNDAYYERAISIFANKRIQFALIFPASAFLQFDGDLPVDYRSYAIANAPKYVTGHFLCSDSNAGRKAIATLNQAIQTLYQSESFIQTHMRYLPQDAQQEIKHVIQKTLRNQEQNYSASSSTLTRNTSSLE
ncbi:hypothetical protein [Alteromonas facilis]|uniref:hypothetical protein n=1 Tax=Alteromonas facilis TaxID=2048004 RepID=UPI000C28B714|nr:hypothetical protein [Alteromonas facilis]